MGLDCYIVHNNDRERKFTHEDDDRIKDINLCGGMFSGFGVDGSFRGKFYNPLIFELSNGEHTWYIDQSDEDPYIYSDTLKEQADLLADLIQVKVDIADEDGIVIGDEDIIYQSRCNCEYTYKEVQDLEILLRVAAGRKAVMTVWY